MPKCCPRWTRSPSSSAPSRPETLNLPHQYPFRLIDRAESDEVTILLGHGRRLPKGSLASELQPTLPLSLALEMMAQAALVVLTRDPGRDGPPMGLLAGISRAHMHRTPRELSPGDRLIASVTLKGRFGRAVKALCRIEGPESRPIAEAELLLSFEE